MASNVLAPAVGRSDSEVGGTALLVRQLLAPLASLRLTVTLFGLAIVLVLFGTLAQHRKDIWEVVDTYFRCAIAWVEFQDLLPGAFFGGTAPRVPGKFPFPGGWLIGAAMAANLLAAHGLRFKPQASGSRLWAGWAVIAVGAVLTWVVIASGSNKDGLQHETWLTWPHLWELFKLTLAGGWLGVLYALVRSSGADRPLRTVLVSLSAVLGVAVVWLYAQGDAARLDDSAMRILWQLMKGTFAGLVLLAGCVMVFKKRAGIVLLHGGIGLMMVSEVLVGTLAVEGQMQIDEGQTVNFVQDIRAIELAVVDASHPQTDDVVAVPQSVLLSGRPITHADLPFDVEVVKFYKNSEFHEQPPAGENLATAGAGVHVHVTEAPPVSGTDSSGRTDLSSAYVKFTRKGGGADYGTYLMSLYLKPQAVQVGEKSYDVQLRWRRTYKPYSVHLIDVRKNDYMGTDTPRDYRSVIRLLDEERGVDLKEHHIWMNNPLRYAGETFYQSSYFRDPVSGAEATTLAVVTNTGWMIPYVSCMLVAVGMLGHFGGTLVRFLRRRPGASSPAEADRLDAARAGAARPAAGSLPAAAGAWRGESAAAARLTALAIVVVCGAWLAGKARPARDPAGDMRLAEFGRIPIVYQGRPKPIDTLARNSLRIISDRQTFVDEHGRQQPAIRWLLDTMARTEDSFQHRVFRIENLELLNMLGLQRREGMRYALAEFGSKLPQLGEHAEKARKLDASQLTILQRKILELERKIGIVDLLVKSFSAPDIRPESARDDLFRAIRQQQALEARHPPLAVPPPGADGQWQTFGAAWTRGLIQRHLQKEAPPPATEAWTKMLVAYAQNDVSGFNAEVAAYHNLLAARPPEHVSLPKVNFEAYFNHVEPFYHALVLYVGAFVLTALSWLGWRRPLNTAAFWLIVFTLVVHTLALAARIYISGRPPVTNLYSSAVFIGWGAVVLGIVLEAVYRIGIGNVIASVSGFAALLIAHVLAGDGDTFTVLQAVLDTQFWLATHVVCITLGYATTFVAGLLGVLYILRGVATPSLTPAVGKDLARMIYGTVCFAIFFSFVGTVLGGLWADDSWGRFWGWDPKENGALIIVLWNALVLHARWGGMVKDRGLAVLAVGGNIVTSWSWFGVNELGVGLHSYGFTEGVLLSLGLFVLSQAAIIGLGCLPRDMWWSSREA